MFEPENDIERALMRATSEPAERPSFARALMDAEIFVVLIPEGGPIMPGSDGRATVPAGATLRIASAQRDDQTVLAFFTAPSRARIWYHGEHIIAPDTTRDLFSRAPEMAYVLNPGSDYGKEFTEAEVRRLLAGQFDDGAETIVIDRPTEILLAHPKVNPDSLITALGRELEPIKTVRGAWLMLAMRAGAQEQSWMLGVDHTGDWQDVRAAIGRAVRGDVLQGRLLDAKAIDGSELSSTLRTGIPVIAQRRGFLRKLFS